MILALYGELKPYCSTTYISQTAQAVAGEAVDRFPVDLDRAMPGLVSDLDGCVTYSASADAETYSLLDQVARRALCTKAQGLSATRQDLPDGTQIVAILRYRF
ncbi:hypothetical protein ABEV34_00360 [Methylorubrum rhodesianum]|uniref:hypothetical protein n=1 Tax=Methylorubrum rhodesianum TaxID=29427 RepID=UPI003D287726